MSYTSNLTLVQPMPEHAARTCGPYWYLIMSHGTSTKAFCRRESFLKWLEERGLSLSEPLVKQGVHAYQKIIGEYKERSYMADNALDSIKAVVESRQLSNGKYTLTKITDEGGTRTVHYLNTNVKSRIEYDYQESRRTHG